MQYKEEDKITALGTLFSHKGYKIVSWNTDVDANGKPTGKGVEYKIGSDIPKTAWDGKENQESQQCDNSTK